MKINIKNKEALELELDQVQNKTHVRLIDSGIIDLIAGMIDRRLETLLPKKYHVGIVANVDFCAQDFPNSYKGSPESTQFVIQRFPSGWFVTKIYRSYCLAPSKKIVLTMTDEHKNKIVEHVIDFKNWGF